MFVLRPTAASDIISEGRRAWNNRRIGWHKAGAEATAGLGDPLLLDHEGLLRDQALFDPAIESKLRGCDLVNSKAGASTRLG